MVKIGKKKTEMMDFILAGVVKGITEPMLAPVVGNANVISGVAKLGLGYAVGKFMGNDKLSRILQMALFIDGSEDLVYSIFRGGGINIGGVSGATEGVIL
jgi:hypothetical protein